MKSRYKKYLNRIEKRSPKIGFSVEDVFQKGDVLNPVDMSKFTKKVGLDQEYLQSHRYPAIEEEMVSNLLQFLDNYLLCGGHQYVYLLIPKKDGNYQIVEKESIKKWVEAYWKKEDPLNLRDWRYFDEDINDLFEYIYERFVRQLKRGKQH